MKFLKDTCRIAFFGGGASLPAMEGLVRLRQNGFEIVAGDHSPQEAVVLHNAGIPCARTREEALSGANLVLTACEGTQQLEDLMLGEGNLLEMAAPGTMFVDLTVVPAGLAREVAAMAELQSCSVVDAPLVNLGEHETACVFVGGLAADVAAVGPLMPFLAERMFFFEGRPGDGQLACMTALISFAGSIMGLVEALAMARISGMEPERAFEVMAGTLGGSRVMVEFAQRVVASDFEGRILVHDLLFWLDAALEGADACGVAAPVLETAYSLCDLLACVGGEHLSVQALALLYEDEATCAKFGLDWTRAEGREDYQRAREEFERQHEARDPWDEVDFGGPARNLWDAEDSFPPIGGYFSDN